MKNSLQQKFNDTYEDPKSSNQSGKLAVVNAIEEKRENVDIQNEIIVRNYPEFDDLLNENTRLILLSAVIVAKKNEIKLNKGLSEKQHVCAGGLIF